VTTLASTRLSISIAPKRFAGPSRCSFSSPKNGIIHSRLLLACPCRLQSSQLAEKSAWHFDVSTGLKRVLGRELITDDEVAILEMVKNSFDASADRVAIWFGPQSIVIADNGIGMSFNDLHSKWLFVAYSAKRPENTSKDYRDRAAERGHFAGSKGVGRFSSDRLGEELVLQTRPANPKATTVHSLFVDWNSFEHDDTQHFEKIPVSYSTSSEFELPDELRRFGASLSHGTVIQIRKLRRPWDRDRLLALKSSLAKLINPFGDEVDKFAISIIAPAEMQQDEAAKANAKEAGEKVIPGKLVNGRVGNFIFSALKEKTTFIEVEISDGLIRTALRDRGELIYRVQEANTYSHLNRSGFRCEIYYLNQSAKLTFARRIGVPSVRFGSVFVFRNGFRVYPIGDENDDWFGLTAESSRLQALPWNS
jgi:hypothetical protein